MSKAGSSASREFADRTAKVGHRNCDLRVRFGLVVDRPCDWKEGPVKAGVDLSDTLLTRNDKISNRVGLASKQLFAAL